MPHDSAPAYGPNAERGSPNLLLRARRQATPSPRLPGEPMSRAELAEAVNAHLWRATGRRYALDAHTLARYERGVVRWPNATYRSALRAVLNAATDTALGFRPPRRRPSTRQPRTARADAPGPEAHPELNAALDHLHHLEDEVTATLEHLRTWIRAQRHHLTAAQPDTAPPPHHPEPREGPSNG